MPDRMSPSRTTMKPGPSQDILFLAVLSPEVGFLDILVHHEACRVVLQNDPARLHDIAPGSNRQCHVSILLHQKDRGSTSVNLSDDLKDGLNEPRGQPKRRLVHHEEAWSGHPCAADGPHLLLTAGQGSTPLETPLRENGKKGEHPLA